MDSYLNKKGFLSPTSEIILKFNREQRKAEETFNDPELGEKIKTKTKEVAEINKNSA